MTKRNKSISTFLFKTLALLFCSAIIFSCEDEPDLGPLPTVEIEVPNFGEPGTDIEFINNSTGADGGALTYLWEFGDGDQSTNAEPSHEYDAPGEYVVSLTATTERGATETVSDTLIIGERFLTRVDIYYIDTIAFINDANDTIIRPWDKDNGPDLFFDLENQNGDVLNANGQIINNAPPFALETPVSITASGDFKLLNESYTISLFDIDENELGEYPSEEDFDEIEELDVIAFGSFNPTSQNITFNPNSEDPFSGSFDSGIDQETGEGALAIGDNFSFYIELYFEIKLDE